MFSYLSRGYGTWEGIAKLEKPDSAISPVSEEFTSFLQMNNLPNFLARFYGEVFGVCVCFS